MAATISRFLFENENTPSKKVGLQLHRRRKRQKHLRASGRLHCFGHQDSTHVYSRASMASLASRFASVVGTRVVSFGGQVTRRGVSQHRNVIITNRPISAAASFSSPAPRSAESAPGSSVRGGRGARGAASRGGRGGRGRGGGGSRGNGGRGDNSPQVKRRPRQFSDDQNASIKALQALVDAKAVPLCRLAKGKANLFLDGAPIVYGGAVETVSGDPQLSDAVVVVDHVDNVVGWGTYNPHSMYRVRVLQMAWEVEVTKKPDTNVQGAVKCDVGEVIKQRIKLAFELRETLGLVNDQNTTTYRLLNAEGDRLSGCCVDVYGDVGTKKKFAVVSSSSAWTQKHKADIVKSLGMEAGVTTVVWRVDAKMLALETGTEKWTKQSERSESIEGDDDDEDDDGNDSDSAKSTQENPDWATQVYDTSTLETTELPTTPLLVKENGVSFEVDLMDGHKTGFYVDQRDNRLNLRKWSQGKDKVLDVCCYTGGFALNAALGGALRVVGVDSSQKALDMASKNAVTNGVSKQCSFIKAEAFKHLEFLLEQGEANSYDIIVLDPPKLAPNAAALQRATPKYVGLNKRAMQLLKPGGLLVTCSCSGAVTQNRLLPDVVVAAAASAGKTITALGPARGPGEDQPLEPGYPEGNYLTVLVYRVL